MYISVAINESYVLYTYVMLTSVFHNADEPVCCYILHSSLSAKSQTLLCDLAADYQGGQIQFIEIDPDLFSGILASDCRWSKEIFYKLLLADVLPKEVDRVLSLDADIIVLKSLAQLYHTDFDDKLLVVCPGPGDAPGASKNLSKTEGKLKLFEIPFQEGHQYFNVGVLLWNLDALRGIYSLKDYIEIWQQYGEYFDFPEQDLLNYMFWKDVKYAETDTYNYFARVAQDNGIKYANLPSEIAIIHYIGAKPWSVDNFHFELEQYWWDYARQTPFYFQLCEEFVHDSMMNPAMMQFTANLLLKNKMLQDNLNESVALNQKMLGLLQNR